MPLPVSIRLSPPDVDSISPSCVLVCRFAKECLLKTRVLVRKLEVTLGPDTGDLAMRMGIHSGPVTAGVLRGERSRFQVCCELMFPVDAYLTDTAHNSCSVTR